jgi:predicted DNA-binding protein
MSDYAQTRRLNINVPERTYQELQDLARRTGRSMTEVMRTAFSLAEIALRETASGNTLAVAKPDGTLLREIVIPK